MTSDLKWFDQRIEEIKRTLGAHATPQEQGYASLELQDLIEEREERYRRYLREDRETLQIYLTERCQVTDVAETEFQPPNPDVFNMERGVIIICVPVDERVIKHQVDRRIRAIGRRLGVQCELGLRNKVTGSN